MQRKSYYLAVLIGMIAIIGASLLLYSVRTRSIAHVEDMFIEQQLLLAKQTAAGIRVTIHDLTRELELLSKMPAIINMDEDEIYKLLEQNFRHVKDEYVNDVAVMDSEGMIRVPLKAPQLKGKDFSFREYYRRARRLTTSEPAFELIDFKGVDIGRKGIIIAMPIFNNKWKFSGLVLYTIKVDDLISAFLPPEFSENEFWIIDASGSVVSHPSHEPGIMIKEQPDLNETFLKFLEDIRTVDEYGGEYISHEGIRKLAVSYRAMIVDQAWFFVITSPTKTVIETLVHLSSKYTTGGIIVILIIMSSSLITIQMYRGWNAKLREEMSRRKLTEEALKESEERFRAAFESAAIGASMIDTTGMFIDLNRALCEMLGYTKKELLSKTFSDITHSDDINIGLEQLKNMIEGHYDRTMFEKRYVRKNGEIIHTIISPSLIRNASGEPMHFVTLWQDITERKLAEETLKKAYDELELRVQERTAELLGANIKLKDEVAERKRAEERLAALASELTLTEERERRNIVDDLHDHVVQNLAMAKMRLVILGRSVPESVSGDLDEITSLVEKVAVDTRTLMFNISPPILYDLGFMEAVAWIAERIQQQSGITIKLEDGLQGCKMEQNVSVILFKAVRELLTNTVKHASADKARVSASVEGDGIHVCVGDDGIGYDPGGISASDEGTPRFGIFNILERIKYIGGTVEIDSAPGKGTRVEMIVPLMTDGGCR